MRMQGAKRDSQENPQENSQDTSKTGRQAGSLSLSPNPANSMLMCWAPQSAPCSHHCTTITTDATTISSNGTVYSTLFCTFIISRLHSGWQTVCVSVYFDKKSLFRKEKVFQSCVRECYRELSNSHRYS